MAVTRTLVTHRKVSAESIEKKNVEDMYLVPDLDEMEMMEEEVREVGATASTQSFEIPCKEGRMRWVGAN